MAETPRDLSAKALLVHELLLKHYGEPPLRRPLDPLSELILTILSQNTADVNSGRAYRALRDRFPTWEAVLEADPTELARAIRIGGLANAKAPRIQQILRKLKEERGDLSLDFLERMSVAEARAYLLALPGVGPKTAACVLLFSLHKPAFPVDTHVYRVTQRLGLIPLKATPEKAGLLLEELVPQKAYYPFHINLIRHGRAICKAAKPRCEICPIAQVCDYLRHSALQKESTEQEARKLS